MSRIKVRIQPFSDRTALQLQWTDPATLKRRTKSTGTADHEAAEQARADLEYELNHGLTGEPAKLTWAAFRQAFEAEHLAALRPNSQRSYAWSFNAFEADCSPGLLTSINQRTLSVWVAHMRQTLAPSSITIRLEHLHAVLRWGAEQDLLAKVPHFPKIDLPARTPRPVPEELFERLLAAASDSAEMRAYLRCGWLAGLRRGEAANLHREMSEAFPWLDREHRRIWLPAAFTKGKADQWVPLDQELQAALAALPVQGQRYFHLKDRTWTWKIDRLAKVAGVRLTMRALRRGFVCRYAGKVPAQVLKKLARHADIQTTLGFYANVDEAVEEAVFGSARCNTAVPKP